MHDVFDYCKGRPRSKSGIILGLLLLLVVAVIIPGYAQPGYPTIKDGWPVDIGGAVYSSPVLGDLDGDGGLEVIVASRGAVYALNADGSVLPGWPINAGYGSLESAALGDLDLDGRLDVVYATGQYAYAWDRDGNLLPGWPVEIFGTWQVLSPALGDLNGDGQLEVILPGEAALGAGLVFAWNSDGSSVSGWPVDAYIVSGAAALGDLDGDGELEVIVGAWDSVYAWNSDGSVVSGWPVQTCDMSTSAPALGDIDGDGGLEVVAAAGCSRIHAWNSDGSSVLGWPVDIGSGLLQARSPVLGDLDGDGDLEILIGCPDSLSLFALNSDGTIVPGWPVPGGTGPSPALADLDGDGELEVITTRGSWVHAFNSDGSPVDGWPIWVDGPALYSSPALDDLDRDGQLEVILGSPDQKVYVWELGPGSYNPDMLPWPMFHQNMHRTGTLDVCLAGVPAGSDVRVVDSFGVVGNPTDAETVFSLSLRVGAHASLKVVDVSGRLVWNTYDRYWEPGVHQISWYNWNNSGQRVTPGMYFVTLSANGTSRTERVVVVR